jgi:hypothetical protein
MLVIQLSFFISSSEISSLATGPIVFSNNKASGNSVLSSTTFRPSQAQHLGMDCFWVLKVFLKKINFYFIFLIKINFFLIFFNYFDILILKIIFKK